MKRWGVALLFLLSSAALLASSELKPYTVYLKPGTVLTRTADKKSFTLEKGIYAKVLETSPTKRDHFLVYDKYGVAQYETLSHGIVEIEKDIQILPNVNADVIYPPPSTFQSTNKHAYFDTQFNVHLDRLEMSPFNSIYNQELSTAYGNRWEIRTLYSSELPVNFGLGINYQTATWKKDLDKIKLSILSLGPQIQHYLYTEEKMAISLHFSGEFAPIYRTSSGNSVEKYNALLLDLGLEMLWQTDFGKWSLGSHYRRHNLSLNSSTRAGSNPLPEEISVNSIGAMVGYKYEWDL